MLSESDEQIQIQAKVDDTLCTIVVKNEVTITRIWNRVINFGIGSGYAVPATNHY